MKAIQSTGEGLKTMQDNVKNAVTTWSHRQGHDECGLYDEKSIGCRRYAFGKM